MHMLNPPLPVVIHITLYIFCSGFCSSEKWNMPVSHGKPIHPTAAPGQAFTDDQYFQFVSMKNIHKTKSTVLKVVEGT